MSESIEKSRYDEGSISSLPIFFSFFSPFSLHPHSLVVIEKEERIKEPR